MAWSRDDAGQSLVEIALALPVLLLLLIGTVDVARLVRYAVSLDQAAREGAWYAARDANVAATAVTQRVCDATGWVAYAAPCPTGLTVTLVADPGGDRVTVEATYRVELLSAYLAERVMRMQPVPLRASATLPYIGYVRPQ